jgi:signal transduction histidine kinase
MSGRPTRAELEATVVALRTQLAEALDQQTATSEILRAISRAQVDAQPVFDIIAASARRLCGATYGQVQLYEGELIRLAALDNVDPEAAEAIRRVYPLRVGDDNLGGRVISRRDVVQIPDLLEDAGYRYKGTWEASGLRSLLGVPMLRGDAPIGAIAIARRDPGAFPDSQVELLRTFADQAVIAIENVRLFKELAARNRELTETLNEQMATSEILRVISRSPTDVQPVFDAIMENAVALCGAVFGRVFRHEAGLVSLAGHKNFPDDAGDFPRAADDETLAGRAARTGRLLDSPNVDEDPDVPGRGRAAFQARGVRSVVAVPIVREGQAIGVIIVGHASVGAFTNAHLDLLRTFAEQAAIAIENVRLFTELQAKNRALTETLEQQTATGEILRVISRSPTDLQPVFDTIAASAARLCGGLYGLVFRYDGELITLEAWGGGAPERLDVIRSAYPTRPGRQTVAARAILGRRVIVVANAQDSHDYPDVAERARAIGYRSILSVPMLRGDAAIGAINVVRVEAVPFTDAQIELLRTFADQAVIAIENVRLFHEIEDKGRQLEVASRHKSEFLASMSHELRTPLNAIIGFADVLADRMFGEVNDKQAEYLRDILDSGRHLLSLINDILDLSKIEAGRMELDPAEFDLPSAIDDALTLVRERAVRHDIALGRTVDERLGPIHADERKVKQVLLNLLSNALKFTARGGRVDVGAVAREGMAEVSVTDTGVGIAAEDQAAVFEEFRQVGTASRKVEGTGLGLALSRKFIELHGGRIWVTSEPGVGSTFTFTLPLTRSDAPLTR